VSYDIYLEIDTGRTSIDTNGQAVPDPTTIWQGNCTSNVAPMWRHAGADLAALHRVSAPVAAEALAPAIRRMEEDPATYLAMNPANGWGNYNGCLQFLRDLHAACVDHPKTTVSVWR